MIEKKLLKEGEGLISSTSEAATLYSTAVVQRNKIKEKIQNALELQISNSQKRASVRKVNYTRFDVYCYGIAQLCCCLDSCGVVH